MYIKVSHVHLKHGVSWVAHRERIHPPMHELQGDKGSIPETGRSPGEGNGNPLQYFCLGNPMERGDWWAIVHEVTKESEMTQQQQQFTKLANKQCLCVMYFTVVFLNRTEEIYK